MTRSGSYMPDGARHRRPLRVTLDAEERAALEALAEADRLPVSRVIGRLAREEQSRRAETTKPRRR